MKKKPKKKVAAPAPNRKPAMESRLGLVIPYVVLVLGVDALAALRCSWPLDWSVFRWRLDDLWNLLSLSAPAWTHSPLAQSFDIFKFLFWLVIPFCVCARRMEWSWLSPRGWTRRDWALLAVLLVGGAVAVLSIRYLPSLARVYRGFGNLPWEERCLRGLAALVWTSSWLVGWEFLHRYVLLRAVALHLPRFGWLLVPLSEFTYHLQKPGWEAFGMVIFSLILTWWSLKRRNLLLPFLAHLYVELLLTAALVFLL